MSLYIAVILILGFIIIYYLFIQVYSVLFRITGLTKEKSIFQAISLLTNSGYTTSEAEVITSDKTRRRIALASMITGYAFSVIIISLIINMLNNLSDAQEENTIKIILIAFGVFVLIFVIFKLPFVRKYFERAIERIAIKLLKKGSRENIITLLDNYGKDAIAEVLINVLPTVFEGKTLAESNVRNEYNMNILMLKRKSKVIEVTKDTYLQKGDVIVLFASYQNIKDLFAKKLENVEEVLDSKTRENVIELIDNYGSDAMAEITVNIIPEFMKNKTIFESNLKSKYQINILMLKRNDRPLNVTKDTVVEEQDQMVVFGPYKNIKNVFIYDIDNEVEQ